MISDPPGLGAKIDGREIGTTPIARHEVVPGTYEVLVSDRRYFDKGKRITVARGGHGEVRVKLEAKIAWLNIESNPPDARGPGSWLSARRSRVSKWSPARMRCWCRATATTKRASA